MSTLLNLYILSTREKISLDVKSKIVLGRVAGKEEDGTLNIDLSESMAYQLGVSRRHLMLVPEADEILAFDLSSHNGTTINGELMSSRKGYPLKDGDELQLGKFVIRVYFRAEVPYEKFKTAVLPRFDYVSGDTQLPERGITAPLPDIRNTLNVTQPLRKSNLLDAEVDAKG
jgi:pSer/pThr/pTyr-binding forkhead associated (FHA) protein